MNVRAPITPYTMALQEKTLRGTMYGSVRPNLDFPRLVDLYLDGRLEDRRAGEPDLQAQRDQRGVRGAAERPGGARRRRVF